MIMASQSTAAINILSDVTVRVKSRNNRILSDAFGVSTGSQLELDSFTSQFLTYYSHFSKSYW